MTKKKLFLLDAYALIFRGYYAFIKNPRINSKGIDTSAILGFMNSLLEIIKKEKPEYLAVAFDKGGSKLRNDMYSDYKAHRDETPEAIKIAVPYIQNILKAMYIPILELEGYEADDIIGTIAKTAEKKNFKTYMVTPDKDFAQLVSENIVLYKPSRMGNGVEIWGIEDVRNKFEVQNPIQVIDFLAMMGDKADNIPGLPGVGEKTAKSFIKAYGSIEQLFEHVGDLKGKLKEKIENNKDIGRLSKKLATIILDVPIPFDEETLKFSMPDKNKVEAIFQDLEFRRMIETFRKYYGIEDEGAKKNKNNTSQQLDLFSKPPPSNSSKSELSTISDIPHIYQSIDTPKALELFVEKLMRQKEVCFDTETTNIKAIEAHLVGIAFSWTPHKGYYIPFGENEDIEHKLNVLKPFFESTHIKKIGHNIKYDIQVLSNYDIEVKPPLFDTMVSHYLINTDMRHKMDILSEAYLNYKPIAIETLIGKKEAAQKSMRTVELSKQVEYAVEDADITLQLKAVFDKLLQDNNAKKLFEEVEMPMVSVLADIEIQGIAIESNILKQLSEQFQKELLEIEDKIYDKSGEKFNISSPKQLGIVLFDKMKIVNNPKKTKTGQYSTSEEVLSYLSSKHPIIKDILEYRQIRKLQNTYVEALPKDISKKTGRIHTSFIQTVTSTGRLSSNNPNLQNIPIRSQRGQAIRKAFVPKNKNYILLSADYSQIELRIIAAFSGDERMIKSFKNKEDIHLFTAAKVFNIPIEAVTKEQRSHAKTVNFGIIYGVSAFGLSNQTNLSVSESKALIENYYKTYPKLKDYISSQIQFAQDRGYVETILGRRRYLRDIYSNNHVVRSAAERNAVNAPIQGSAADIIKIAMINIQKKLKEYESKMLLQVHDELVFDVKRSELEQIRALVKYEMENAYKLSVPLDVEIGEGNNWLEAH